MTFLKSVFVVASLLFSSVGFSASCGAKNCSNVSCLGNCGIDTRKDSPFSGCYCQAKISDLGLNEYDQVEQKFIVGTDSFSGEPIVNVDALLSAYPKFQARYDVLFFLKSRN